METEHTTHEDARPKREKVWDVERKGLLDRMPKAQTGSGATSGGAEEP